MTIGVNVLGKELGCVAKTEATDGKVGDWIVLQKLKQQVLS